MKRALLLSFVVACSRSESVPAPPKVVIPDDLQGEHARKGEVGGFASVHIGKDSVWSGYDPNQQNPFYLQIAEGARVGDTGYQATKVVVVRYESGDPKPTFVTRCTGTMSIDDRSLLTIALGGPEQCTRWNAAYEHKRVDGYAKRPMGPPMSTALGFDAGYRPTPACAAYRACLCSLRIDDARYAKRCAEMERALTITLEDDASACTSKLDQLRKEKGTDPPLPRPCAFQAATLTNSGDGLAK